MDDCSIEQPLFAGRYALYSRIASGGMASVYLGRLLGRAGFRRTVAVKRLHAHLALDPDFRAMFLDEARLAARIRHPNVVPTLDIVNTNDELFLVMEYIDGESLSALVRRLAKHRMQIPMPIISAIAGDMLAGLHAAHEAKGDGGEALNIVHRDVSPQNVLVGSDGVSRVLDFGVAKAIGNSVQTRGGQIKGKLAYMAPEQMRDGTLTRAADIYAAAVVLWELAMNRRLWAAESEAQLVAKMVNSEIPPAHTTPFGGSSNLDKIIMKGLAKDPAARFPSAREFARALEWAIPPATHQTVADWFGEVARDQVAQRRDVLARIESVSSKIIISSQPPMAGDVTMTIPGGPQDIVPTPRPPGGGQLGAVLPSLEVDLSQLTPSSVSSVSSLSATAATTTSPTVLTGKRTVWPFIVAGAICTMMMTVGLLLIIHVLFPPEKRRAAARANPPPAASLAAPALSIAPPSSVSSAVAAPTATPIDVAPAAPTPKTAQAGTTAAASGATAAASPATAAATARATSRPATTALPNAAPKPTASAAVKPGNVYSRD